MEPTATVNNNEFIDYRRNITGGGDNADTPSMTPRAGGRKMSARDMRTPADLTRSRRVGLSREACWTCGAIRGPEGFTTHNHGCTIKNDPDIPGKGPRWVRVKATPLPAVSPVVIKRLKH